MSGIQRIKMRGRRSWFSRASWITSLTCAQTGTAGAGLRGAQFGRQPARSVGRAERLRACLLFPGQR